MNSDQIIKVRAMLRNAGISTEDDKKQFVMMITKRTESLSACTLKETQDIIEYLQTNSRQPTTFKTVMNASAEKQRRYIIAMAHQMRWHKPGTIKIDMVRVNNWCIQYSGFGKRLNKIDDMHLPALVTQFKMVLESFLKGF